MQFFISWVSQYYRHEMPFIMCIRDDCYVMVKKVKVQILYEVANLIEEFIQRFLNQSFVNHIRVIYLQYWLNLMQITCPSSLVESTILLNEKEFGDESLFRCCLPYLMNKNLKWQLIFLRSLSKPIVNRFWSLQFTIL